MGASKGGVFERKDNFVIDMESLSSTISDKDFISNPNISKTLSRKWSQRIEKKAAPETDFPSLKGDAVIARNTEVNVVQQTEIVSGPFVLNQEPRKQGRRSSFYWVGPRRVLMFFATLSSMGTLVLLYFTLSMATMGVGDESSSSA
ncbi:hypothetical protein QJS04_geneDACA019123 [Acorus gramineus]|uniref:Uncharacterized protein n=1 Tax=Acorus gramineus TaxID=55184 RepID=A0AAV9A7F5_ACOGR|nr:hypothetical protein QJS04_geneDACA019123 [Acorus gramineus]